MTFHLWLAFAAAYLLTTLSPGPNVLLVIRNTLRYGSASTVLTICGNLLSQLLIVLLVACGVGATVAALPPLFLAMKLIGAAYLLWLGFKQIRSAGVPAGQTVAEQATTVMPRWGVFREALLVSGSNPKTLIFLSAFMPQFVQPEHPLAPQFGIMYLTIAGTVLCVHTVYACSASRLKQRLKHHRLVRSLKALGGSLFVLLGLRLLTSQQN